TGATGVKPPRNDNGPGYDAPLGVAPTVGLSASACADCPSKLDRLLPGHLPLRSKVGQTPLVSTLDSAATGIARERLGLIGARKGVLPTVISGGLVGWGLFLAHGTYDLDSPGAAFYRAFDRPFYTDMVTKLPAGLDHLAMLGACVAATTG